MIMNRVSLNDNFKNYFKILKVFLKINLTVTCGLQKSNNSESDIILNLFGIFIIIKLK